MFFDSQITVLQNIRTDHVLTATLSRSSALVADLQGSAAVATTPWYDDFVVQAILLLDLF